MLRQKGSNVKKASQELLKLTDQTDPMADIETLSFYKLM